MQAATYQAFTHAFHMQILYTCQLSASESCWCRRQLFSLSLQAMLSKTRTPVETLLKENEGQPWTWHYLSAHLTKSCSFYYDFRGEHCVVKLMSIKCITVRSLGCFQVRHTQTSRAIALSESYIYSLATSCYFAHTNQRFQLRHICLSNAS